MPYYILLFTPQYARFDPATGFEIANRETTSTLVAQMKYDLPSFAEARGKGKNCF